MVACDRRLYYPRGQYRLQLLWHERVLPFLRAGVRLEPDRNLGCVLAGAHRVRHFGSYRRLPDRPRWCPKNALHRPCHVLPRFFCSQLRGQLADALHRHRSRYRARFQPGLQHADQRADRESVSRKTQPGLRDLSHGTGNLRSAGAGGGLDDRIVGLANGGGGLGLRDLLSGASICRHHQTNL